MPRKKASDFDEGLTEWLSKLNEISRELDGLVTKLNRLPRGPERDNLVRILVEQGGVDPARFDPKDRGNWSKADWIAESEFQKSKMRQWLRSGYDDQAKACEVAAAEATRRASLL